MKTLLSQIDSSINFVLDASLGKFEARYVARPDSPYFICYLSSQSGCRQGCKMCHLTANKQTKLVDATLEDFLKQADLVLQHWNSLGLKHERVHFNFMARGEPLACKTILEQNDELFKQLAERAQQLGLASSFLISTILPKSFENKNLLEVFKGDIKPEIYYSVYSPDPSFRKTWLPNAMSAEIAIKKLALWVQKGGQMKLHYALISGANAGKDHADQLIALLKIFSLQPDINIVRYNAPLRASWEANAVTMKNTTSVLAARLPEANVRIIPRVGADVYASCGMFIPREREEITCKCCQKRFFQTKVSSVFCSKECSAIGEVKTNVKRKRKLFVKKTPLCRRCGKEFVRKASSQRYCSKECASPPKIKLIKTVTCVQCSKEFSYSVRKMSQKSQRYCSKECNKAWRINVHQQALVKLRDSIIKRKEERAKWRAENPHKTKIDW